jgi:hypothetical protein
VQLVFSLHLVVFSLFSSAAVPLRIRRPSVSPSVPLVDPSFDRPRRGAACPRIGRSKAIAPDSRAPSSYSEIGRSSCDALLTGFVAYAFVDRPPSTQRPVGLSTAIGRQAIG